MFIENVVVLGMLAWWAIQDIRAKSVGLRGIIVIGMLSFIYSIVKYYIYGCETYPTVIVAGIIFVVFLLIMSVGVGALGVADVAIICMLIAIKGVVFAVGVFMIATTIMATVVMLFMVVGRIKRKDSVAFVPFMWVASLVVIICV